MTGIPNLPFGDDEHLGNQPGFRAAGRHISSFTFSAADLSLPAAGGSTTTIERFLGVAHDSALEAFYIHAQASGTPTTGGVLVVSLFQEGLDGEELAVIPQTPIRERPSPPLQLGYARRVLTVGLPLILRLQASPGDASSWWDTLTYLNGSLHILSTK